MNFIKTNRNNEIVLPNKDIIKTACKELHKCKKLQLLFEAKVIIRSYYILIINKICCYFLCCSNILFYRKFRHVNSS